MNTLQPYEAADTQLSPGTTLIEASAGTGKTFTIATLILRFVLEERLSIGQILAVTYTVAATEELRDRIRKRLSAALEDLRRMQSTDEVVNRFLRVGNVRQGINDLDSAVQNFDEASIFTIHGFCQRVLAENAFESGALFDIELMTDPSSIFEEIARDFWRQKFYAAPPLISRLALAEGWSYLELVRLLISLRNHLTIRILPPADDQDCTSLANLLLQKFSGILKEWKLSGPDAAEILATDKNLSHAKDSFGSDALRNLVESFDQLAHELGDAAPDTLNAIWKISASEIAKELIGKKQAPRHQLFDLCEQFSKLKDRYFKRLIHEFIAFVQQEASVRKARLNVVTYDDLLTRVLNALAGEKGLAFARMLAAKYPAALIDEFQDTDPVQYGIFSRAFGGNDSHLYLIGDPKQAIYGFRGADVFTYLQAARAASRRFTLTTNWRSERRLLDAVNLLFKTQSSLGNGIEYRTVNPPKTPRPDFAVLTGDERESRLRFRFLSGDAPDQGAINQGDAETSVIRAVVADLARVRASGVTIGRRVPGLSDMAVLVRTNSQAAKMQEAFRKAEIKSVLQTDRSVFRGDEAREMLAVLDGILEPARRRFLNSALATGLFDYAPEAIVALQEDENRRQANLERLLRYRTLWRDSCFIAMFRNLLVEEKVRERLLQRSGGERKLTNFLHLSELLHCEEVARRLTPEAVRLWLARQIHSKESVEEHQLRLESDDDAVLIATIHKSKGLEYPIVFCPFPWNAVDGSKRKEILFHDPQEGNLLTLDLRDKEEVPAHSALASEELMGESVRMLYVGVTRARNLCYLYAADIAKYDRSPLAAVAGMSPLLPKLRSLEQQSAGVIDVTEIDLAADQKLNAFSPGNATGVECRAREFHGSISQSRMIASFSALTSGTAKEEADAAIADLITPDPAPEERFGMLSSFARGVRGGLFWHELLENLDFQDPDGIQSLTARTLTSHGLDGGYLACVASQIRRLLATQLESGLSLGKVPKLDRLAELEFTYPIASLHPELLQDVFARRGGSATISGFPESLGRLDFQPVRGFMRGFIDLLFRFEGRFYIIDWKSNWLGGRSADYGPAALHSTMLQSFYFLQYHLYTVAVDLFLRRRIPDYSYEKHFGGIFYVFLRGIDPENPKNGIFHDRPDHRLVSDLRNTLGKEQA